MDQLVRCPDTDISSALDKALNDRIDSLDGAELLREIEVFVEALTYWFQDLLKNLKSSWLLPTLTVGLGIFER